MYIWVLNIRDELHKNFIVLVMKKYVLFQVRGLKPGKSLFGSSLKGYLNPMKKKNFLGLLGHMETPRNLFARMSQPWINNIPEEIGGNNGSQICLNAQAVILKQDYQKLQEDGFFGLKKKNTC